jgi:hypothetical protein
MINKTANTGNFINSDGDLQNLDGNKNPKNNGTPFSGWFLNSKGERQNFDTLGLGAQIWLPAVDTKADLPEVPDNTKNYLCRVINDTDKTNNGVWQHIADASEWSYFSDNLDFVDETELSTAISTHNTSETAHKDIRDDVSSKVDSTDLSTAISTHNESKTAHTDIRNSIGDKVDKTSDKNKIYGTDSAGEQTTYYTNITKIPVNSTFAGWQRVLQYQWQSGTGWDKKQSIIGTLGFIYAQSDDYSIDAGQFLFELALTSDRGTPSMTAILTNSTNKRFSLYIGRDQNNIMYVDVWHNTVNQTYTKTKTLLAKQALLINSGGGQRRNAQIFFNVGDINCQTDIASYYEAEGITYMNECNYSVRTYLDLPAPPNTETATLKAVNGKMTWVND